MAATRVLVLGASGKVARLMLPLMLDCGWKVFGVVRNPDYKKELEATSDNVQILVETLEKVKHATDAQTVIDTVKPDYVVWSAGYALDGSELQSNRSKYCSCSAGGSGGPSRTFAVDRDAAKAYIEAAVNTACVKKFLMISYIGSRRSRPSWWTDEDWKAYLEVNEGVLKNYFAAKVEADEYLQAWSKKRRTRDPDFQCINLRPGILTEDPLSGKIQLGKTPSRGKVSRADVADVAVRLLQRPDTQGYFDLLSGSETTPDAVDNAVNQNLDAFEGEDAARIYGLV